MKKLEDMTEPELQELMHACALDIELAANHLGVEKPRFVLVLFNDPKTAQYVANCRRKDIIKAMRETADRLEKNEDVPRGGDHS
jgi:hypothetical protein